MRTIWRIITIDYWPTFNSEERCYFQVVNCHVNISSCNSKSSRLFVLTSTKWSEIRIWTSDLLWQRVKYHLYIAVGRGGRIPSFPTKPPSTPIAHGGHVCQHCCQRVCWLDLRPLLWRDRYIPYSYGSVSHLIPNICISREFISYGDRSNHKFYESKQFFLLQAYNLSSNILHPFTENML